MRVVSWAGLVVAASIASACEVSAPLPMTAPLALEPCHIEGLAEEVLCGVHVVFEDRQLGTGRTLSIHVAILPPLRRNVRPDPLFVLAGGPGQGARSFAPLVSGYFRQVRRTRAIVLVDLRGTGASNPLSCQKGLDEIAALSSGPDLFLGTGSTCAAELAVDPRFYTHASALADLEDIRSRLGYDRVNLWGGSWGTRAALLYASMYPDRVRAVVLDGAVPLEMAFPTSASEDAQRALDRLFDRCSRDPDCAAAFPSPGEEVTALLDSLRHSPVPVSLRHPRTGAVAEVRLTRDAVAEQLRVMLYSPLDAAMILQVVRHATRGDFGPLAAQYAYSAAGTAEGIALGAAMAILCSEDVSHSSNRDVDRQPDDTILGASYANAWRTRCTNWPAGPPLSAPVNATSAVPALILSGEHDPVTPPRWGDVMATHFRDSRHLVVPGAAHSASFSGCVPDLIAGFLDRGEGGSLDTRCAADVPLPPLVTSDAGGRP